ncbi:FadR family transcriptional regulator [Oryzomonas sagensis]|uniref:FadR family transcriptional regulator n=1 Tax=Oryzomonas sagensis TaxID=2603857 RepID=A0ABQ6TS07_9BACT|nr:FadR/GntR family transcriptional regulator [Oryzomonas sagensis]KAB0671823.1 FadR family transcriptional regulator [Oryzomonas sagensis]
MFKHVKQSRAYQDVVEQIQDGIIAGTLKPGSQLPAERDLKEQFGVSRGTLREALRVLEQKGLIEIRTGVAGGSIIREVNSEQLSENLGLLIRNRTVSLRDLAEFREGMEGGVAALAAQRGQEQDMALLRKLLTEAEEHLKEGRKGWDAFIRTDEMLHMALARMSGNQLFISVLESVYYNIHTYYENYLPRGKKILQENFDDLRVIVAAVTERNEEAARELAQGHVRRFNAYMEEKEA